MYSVIGASHGTSKALSVEHSCASDDLYVHLDFLTEPFKPNSTSEPSNTHFGAYALYRSNFLVWVEFPRQSKESNGPQVRPIHILGAISDPGQFCLDETGRVLAIVNAWREIDVFVNGQKVHSIRPRVLDGNVDEEFSIPVLYQVFSSIPFEEKGESSAEDGPHSDEDEKAESHTNKQVDPKTANESTAPGEAYIGNIVYSMDNRIFLATFGAVLSVVELSLGIQRVCSVSIDPRRGIIWCLHRTDTTGVNSIVRLNAYTPQGSLRSSTPLEMTAKNKPSSGSVSLETTTTTKNKHPSGSKASRTLVSEILAPRLLVSPAGSCIVGWQCIRKSLGQVGLEYALSVFSKSGKYSGGTCIEFKGTKIIIAPRIYLFGGTIAVFNRFIREHKGVPLSAIAPYPLDGKNLGNYETKFFPGDVWVAPRLNHTGMVQITLGRTPGQFSVQQFAFSKSSDVNLPIDLGQTFTARALQKKKMKVNPKKTYTGSLRPLDQIEEADKEEDDEEEEEEKERDNGPSHKINAVVQSMPGEEKGHDGELTQKIDAVIQSMSDEIKTKLPVGPAQTAQAVLERDSVVIAAERPKSPLQPTKVKSVSPLERSDFEELEELLRQEPTTANQLPGDKTEDIKLVALDIKFNDDSTFTAQGSLELMKRTEPLLQLNTSPPTTLEELEIGDLLVESVTARKVSGTQLTPAEVEMDKLLPDEAELHKKHLEANRTQLSSPQSPTFSSRSNSPSF